MSLPRVLIVDDSPANLKLARIALEGSNLDLCTASDGEEAEQRLRDFQPQVVLMDLQLPGIDGYDLARRIKSNAKTAHIRVVAVTAYAMPGDRERALAAGCDEYITKPLDPLALPTVVKTELAETSDAASERRRDSAATRSSRAPQRSRPLVLVIEDNPASRKLIRVTLESEGCTVHEAADARSALDWLESHSPRLILQDLVLPDLDGLKLLRRIRNLPHTSEVPVLCLSGFRARMDAARALVDGFAALLLKPVDPIELLDTVHRHIERADDLEPRPRQEGAHVMVVDGDALQRQLAEYHLCAAGLRVTTFGSAQEALNSARVQPPAAIICNSQVPGMNGFELCLSVRQSGSLAQIPVILLSTLHTEPQDRELADRLGADALCAHNGDWAATLTLLKKAWKQPQRKRLALSVDAARDAILRRTQALLDKQLQANAALQQRSQIQAAQLSILAGVTDSLAREPTRRDALADVLAVCLDVAGIEKGALYLQQDGMLTPRHAVGFSAEEAGELGDFFGHARMLQKIVAQGEVVSLASASECVAGVVGSDTDDFLARAGIQTALISPVVWRDRIYGALFLCSRLPELSGPEPQSFARVLGSQLGQAIGLTDAFSRLHESEERFRLLVDSMDSVTVVDRERRVTGRYGRGAAAREVHEAATMTGTSWEERSIPAPSEDTNADATEDEPHGSTQHEAYARALSGQRVVYEWTQGAGLTARHFRDALWPVRDADGQIQSVMRVGHEITDEKRLQAHVMVSDRMASLGMLAAGVAHEINNPLMAVLGNLQLVLDDLPTRNDSDDVRQSLKDAHDAAKRVDAIVRDLRLFSRADDDLKNPVDVHGVLESSLRMARAEIRHRARIVRDYQKVPPIEASEARLGQVFLNLIINAAQALPACDSQTHEIHIGTNLDERGRVNITVRDTGCGIPDDVARKLFTPFVTTKPVGVGTGLGLAICQRIVSSLDGEISFVSQVGHGTTFRVVLPAARRVCSVPAPLPLLRPILPVVPGVQRGRVLIVDDEVLVGSVLSKTLSGEHETHLCTDAREALVLLRQDVGFDVILCDLMMPNMGGMEFYEALIQRLPTYAPRVIFLTGGTFTQQTLDFLERIPNLHLRKPVNLRELRAVVSERIS